jgi:hypothetical protein
MSELQDLKSRIEMLESAVEMLEERITALLDIQTLEPYEIDLSEEQVQKIKDWLRNDIPDNVVNLPDRFRDIANGE